VLARIGVAVARLADDVMADRIVTLAPHLVIRGTTAAAGSAD
jgi:hypothetical protein